MDLTGNSGVDDTPAELAARAEEAARALYLRTSSTVDADSLASAGEMHEVLGSLKLVVESITRCLPELGIWLEERLWTGTLGGESPAAAGYDELTESIFEVTSALSRAHRMSSALGRELQVAQTASVDLAKQQQQ
ncbi:hypothetical protein FHU38_003726 [Saccharomonospora amisosensis]|uniref:Uncharacterized protein n=1 Tax=Saccharomonospora amisosensis TaxID=1128677 RepID=A0A7X5USH0_9PSEU|nr:hypothetical protein [Saccharomonospora amisosensis]NIJ13382.1 hypothetical protein [Saccharomonospora amisosensis]